MIDLKIGPSVATALGDSNVYAVYKGGTRNLPYMVTL